MSICVYNLIVNAQYRYRLKPLSAYAFRQYRNLLINLERP